MEISAVTIEKALEAMHWVICPYTCSGLGSSLSVSSLEDYPHILELAKSYNDLVDAFNRPDYKYAFVTIDFV